jgi:membrane fusion protein, multidrug efflux system
MMPRSFLLSLAISISLTQARGVPAQTVDYAVAEAKSVTRSIDLPGEITPFMIVALHARVAGYVDRILVDRGNSVRKGDLLAEISAPEMAAQVARARSMAQASEADLRQAEAQLDAAQSTAERLHTAAATPGVVAGNELTQADRQVDAARALLASRRESSRAAESLVRSLEDMQDYLKITAPFDGVVTERLVHPGALVGPGGDRPLLVLQQVSQLRLTVAVPEEFVGGIVRGARVSFKVPAYPERSFSAVVSRPSRALDQKTRTMPVELDAANPEGLLAPGMYPTVKWPFQRNQPSILVPKSSVVTTTERTFVIRNLGGKAHWVDVKKMAAAGDMVEVLGELKAGDQVVRRATDEIRDGTPLPSPSREVRK